MVTYRLYPGRLQRTRAAAVLPWVFVIGVVAGTMLPGRLAPVLRPPPPINEAARDAELVWKRAGDPAIRHPVDVVRTIDGDTFEVRVHLWPGLDLTTRVRLRGVDAPEMKAACADELTRAEAAAGALRDLLGRGEVTIFNIGPDKYQGRVVADVATRAGNVADALVASGHVRRYAGGRRVGWCPGR